MGSDVARQHQRLLLCAARKLRWVLWNLAPGDGPEHGGVVQCSSLWWLLPVERTEVSLHVCLNVRVPHTKSVWLRFPRLHVIQLQCVHNLIFSPQRLSQ